MNAARIFLLLSLTIIPLHKETAMAAKRSDDDSLAMQGAELSADAIRQLEESLKQTPDALSIRIKLLGYYTFKQFESATDRAARQQQVLWVIQHHPEATVAGLPYSELDPILDGHFYQDGVTVWKEHVANHPADPAILRNAASYFLLHDSPIAEELLKKGAALEPNNPDWPKTLGHLYDLQSQNVPELDKKRQAAAALNQYERAFDLTTNDTRKSYLLDDLATTAFDAGDLRKASAFAQQALISATSGKKDWNIGNAIHHGNLILGRIALQAGDIEQAKHYLLKAGQTPGSPQLDSFGPNMALAKDLLEKGQKDAVLEYFVLCAKFWDSRSQLNTWAATVKQGGIPDFGANLVY
jgi:tetratricopeptide (TPR) repeat protein